ncbi:MAG: division/cell wall cluster transcriptional repressor MraZ [Pseudomonadales bacterium]|nr:division/cell wall cluster transcriptional repressor MraZ [Pseudomonadales bacterium]
MFRGVNSINLDSKGRMAVPTRYRERLDERCAGKMVVTIDTEERCLLIYPLPEWEDIQRKIEALPSFNPAARRIQRLLIGHATDIDLDGSGRLLLTQPLRDYAHLGKKAVLLGQGNKFELWSEECWSKRNESYQEDIDGLGQLPPEFQSISL